MALIGGVVIASLVLAAVAAVSPSVGFAQRPPSGATSAGPLVTLSTSIPDHGEQVTVIDPETRTMAVYHIDTATGKIVLKSVRNIHYDLKMMEFNGTDPLPGEIRSMLGER
jgi:hypothetical protein